MPTQSLLNGLSGNLQDSESWNRQQALEMIRHTISQTLASLTSDEQRAYVRLQREAHAALTAVEAANTALINAFKTQGLARLRAKIGGQDPETILLHTRYLEPVTPPLPWEPRTSTVNNPRQGRFRRAYDEWKFRPHLSTLSLWDAACLNFGFATQTRQASGHTFVDASYLTGADDKTLTVERFIAITRELDLGGELQATLNTQLAPGGQMHGLLRTSARACLRFEALEAYRNRTATGLTRSLYDRLTHTIDSDQALQHIDRLAMSKPPGVFPEVTLAPSATHVPLPLLLIPVASLGVVSYFPFRPGGALRYHPDARSAHAQFVAQLKESHRKHDLGWFARQLPMVELNEFKRLLSEQQRPEGLAPAAAFLYDSLHYLFPEQTLNDLRFTVLPRRPRPASLVDTLNGSLVQQFQANLATLAARRTDRDVQAVIDGAAAMAAEVLELLLTPLPGGVTGMNRIMQVAVLGSLAHSVIQGANEALKGEASNFASAIGDVADLAVSGLLISTAGSVHRQRMNQLLMRLGNPLKVTRSDGSHMLWKPDISPYATLDQQLLSGQVANAQGIYSLRGKQYAWLYHAEQKRVVEVGFDRNLMRFVLKSDHRGEFAPPILFDPHLAAWALDLKNAHTLSNAQLAERMLPNGSTAVPLQALENLLRSTATPRSTLDAIWNGDATPVNLTEGVRRLQADRVIEQLSLNFHRRDHMPPHADGTVLCLLTQLPEWPAGALINVHDSEGKISETYGAGEQSAEPTTVISLKRRNDGTYATLDAPPGAEAAQEQLFELVLRQQPTGSVLGRAGSPHLNHTQRIARLRLQISALARTRRVDLFHAMTRYAGYTRQDVAADQPARDFVPIKVAQPLVQVTPLLRKLRERYPPLTPANIAQLLEQHPLTAAQHTRFEQDASLPATTRHLLERHRTALRIDAVIDGLYHPRPYNPDTDQWAREFASSLIRNLLKRHFVVTEMANGAPADRYVSTGPDDTTVELLHYGEGRYEAYDIRNGGPIPVSPAIDSFYLAIACVLQPHERGLLGMNTDTDAKGLRKTLGDLMSERRSPEGYVSLINGSLGQYEQNVVLPDHLLPNAEGIYTWQDQQLISLFGSLYPITYDEQLLKWRLKHPQKVGVDTPRLEHNGRGAWRLSSENPMNWDDHRLFYRLGPRDYHVDRQTAERIMRITDTPARALREVHSANLPPPPLLADTSKRFRIEREIEHFIQAMATYSARGNARPDLQLLLFFSLPGWPSSHVLQLIDSNGKTVISYPAANVGAEHTIRMTLRQSRGADPLNSIALNDTVTRALLGELPKSIEERLFKLGKKIAEHAHLERKQLFDRLYNKSEDSVPTALSRFRAHYPSLPVSALNAILEQASYYELKQLHEHNQVGLRLAEQVRLSANDARLNRAFEGVYLNTLGNPDSEKIILHVLKSAAGWPANTRLDIHQTTATGALLGSAGHLDGTERKVLAKVNGRYRAYDDQGRLIDGPSEDLLSTICRVLGDSDLPTLQTSIAESALNQRTAIKALLDIPHLPYWLQPPMRVHTSFIAYPFSLSNLWPFSTRQPVDLVSRVIDLYPRLDRVLADDLIRELDMSDPALLIELQRRKAEYQALDYGLIRWAEAPHANDAGDPLGLNLGRRRHIAEEIRRAWRRETRAPYRNGLFDTHHLKLQLDGNDLPDADFIFSTKSFEHIESLHLMGETFPATANAFLGKFVNLKFLKIDCMLNHLPTSITAMTQLEYLHLSFNNIQLTGESRERLGAMTRLVELHMDGNPLDLTPDVSAMNDLRILSLRGTGIDQWPIGVERRLNMSALLLQENNITELPPALYNDARMRGTNQHTYLHGNPLSPQTHLSIDEYSRREGIRIGGAVGAPRHAPIGLNESDQWLSGIAVTEHANRKALWEQLRNNEPVRADDVFEVLRDLHQTYAYNASSESRQALTARVWTLLLAMCDSTELRNNVCLTTRGAGDCGDSALLAFTNMELEHRIHQAKMKSRTYDSDRALIELATGRFYLDQLDEFSAKFIERREMAALDVDRAEVTLYFRAQLAEEFNLPFHPLELLYTVDDYVTDEVLDDARAELRRLGASPARQEWLLKEGFWIEYLANSHPEPFSTVKGSIVHKVRELNKKFPDKRSDDYLERRQSLSDLETIELNRLVRQLTVATQAALQHA